ncbi:hypothetical protein WICPIJ_009492 [Wickerhamomyces pijperi]|uniref:Uncharacterized protein n=1 Tax=Wickerhamomyces pijperi TaxID=599730 RepID=A0A9P8PNK3_WICPI|nr:hypothetical protein WICPIJ_009492 [Wickerhamomyces pijperi]
MGYLSPIGGFTRQYNKQIVIHSCKFTRGNALEIGGRTAVIRIPQTKKLVIWSSIPIGRELQKAIDLSIDEDDSSSNYEIVAAIVPDIEHTMAAVDLKKQFPATQLIGPSGIKDKPTLKLDHEFHIANSIVKGETISKDLKDFEFVFLPGHHNKELITYFKPTKTLLAADLLFNIPYDGKNEDQYGIDLQTRGLQGWFGRYINPYSFIGRFLFRKLLPKTPENQKGLQEVVSWDVDNFIVSHGLNFENNDGLEPIRLIFGDYLTTKSA